MHEIVFLERFKVLGNHYQWIPRDVREHRPTNDFVWIEYSIEMELKSLTRAKYGTISKSVNQAVKDAVKQEVVKDSFIIDIGFVRLSDKLISQLEQYNMRNEIKLSNLWVLDREGIKRIELREA